MAPRAGITVTMLALAACAAPPPRPASLSAPDLLSSAAFAPAVRLDIVPREEIAALDDDMRAFVAEHTEGVSRPRQRLERLLVGMQERGLFELDYAGNVTRTARETFRDRRGNCLSFTILFVALAREAGLDVDFQMVQIPPTWIGGSELVMLNNHINALISTPFEADYVVDFNLAEYKGNYPSRVVSDDYATALFYSNRGVESLSAGRERESFEYLQHAIAAYPQISGPWVNLGVLYSRLELHEHAESAFLQALERDPRDRSALVNLAKLHRSLGETALADEYAERVRRYQERNPYYHYSLATAAYQGQQPQEALRLLDKAIRLKKDEHQFHFLQGLAYLELGDAAAARASLARAAEHAERDDVKRRYSAKLSALNAGR